MYSLDLSNITTGTKFSNNSFCLSKGTLFYEIHDVFSILKEIEKEALIAN